MPYIAFLASCGTQYQKVGYLLLGLKLLMIRDTISISTQAKPMVSTSLKPCHAPSCSVDAAISAVAPPAQVQATRVRGHVSNDQA